jgi:hypothetical protein
MQVPTLAQRIWWRRRGNIVHGRRPAADAAELASLQEPRDAAMTEDFLPNWEAEVSRHTIVETILEARARRCSGLPAHDSAQLNHQG